MIHFGNPYQLKRENGMTFLVSNSAQLVHLRSWQPRVPQDSGAASNQKRLEVTGEVFRCSADR